MSPCPIPTARRCDTDATPEARGVPTGEFDPVPPLPLTPELPHEGAWRWSEEDVSEPIDPPPAASASRRTLTIQIEPDVGTSAPQDAGEEAPTECGDRFGHHFPHVREILGINHEEEVKAPAEFHLKKKELKEQQEKVRVLRKKWPGTRRKATACAGNQQWKCKLAQEFMQGGGKARKDTHLHMRK
eukprot:Skav217224  [mRNA]  locus=scaffold143:372858:375843:- [translate_table: standard]